MCNRNYLLLLSAYFLSGIGDWLYTLAVPILVFDLTKSALAMSTVYALTFLPSIMVTPFGGVIADRFNRRALLIGGDLMAGLVVLVLALIETFIARSVVPVYPLVLIIASISALYHPPFQSIIPALVKDKELAKANAYIQTADNFISFLGPLVGGGMIAITGALDALYVDAVSFFVSAVLIKLIKVSNTAMEQPSSMNTILQSLKEGFTYAWENPVIKYGCLLFFISNFSISVYHANFMFFLIDILQLKPAEIGTTIALAGIGAMIGSLCAPYLGRWFAEGRIILTCTMLNGFCILFLLWARSSLSVALVCGVVAVFDSIIIVTYFTLRQRAIPGAYLGRAVAVTRLISYAAIPGASILSGWLLQKSGDFNDLILLSALIMTMGGCLGWLTPLSDAVTYRLGKA